MLGARAERVALRYLRERGHRLVARNYSTRRGEIDLITLFKGIVVFTEVKSAIKSPHYSPRDKVDRRKRAKLAFVAEEFLRRRRFQGRKYRFDLIEVSFKSRADRKPQIIHLEGEL